MSETAPPVALARSWHSAFTTLELSTLQEAIPAGIRNAQRRTARADAEYAEPDGEKDVYGVGMSKAAPKDIQALLQHLPSFREAPIAGTSRKLTFVGQSLIFCIRTGDRMRRNPNRLRLKSFSQSRKGYLGEHSSSRTNPPALTIFDEEPKVDDGVPRLADAARQIEDDAGQSELFVAYYNSTARGVGQIMWAPARLDGRYLEFFEPEVLTFRKLPRVSEPKQAAPRPVATFGDSERPPTPVSRRRKPDGTNK